MSGGYMLHVCRDHTGRYFVAASTEGNESKLRVDSFTNGTKVLRLPVTKEDWLQHYVPWSYIDPRELTQHYIEHCARERARRTVIFERLNKGECTECSAKLGERHKVSCSQYVPAPAYDFDECSASGESCSYGNHGPNGELQCRYCGKPWRDGNHGPVPGVYSEEQAALHWRDRLKMKRLPTGKELRDDLQRFRLDEPAHGGADCYGNADGTK